MIDEIHVMVFVRYNLPDTFVLVPKLFAHEIIEQTRNWMLAIVPMDFYKSVRQSLLNKGSEYVTEIQLIKAKSRN